MAEEKLSFEEATVSLIAFAGGAKNDYIESIQFAKEGKFDEAEEAYQRGNENYQLAHAAHFDILNSEEKPEGMMAEVLLIHSEDQLSGAETYKIFAQELIDLYRKLSD